MEQDIHTYPKRTSSGASLFGLIMLGLLIWGGVSLFQHIHPDYTKPWWNGTQDESMCQVVNNGLTKCYTVPLMSNGTEITYIEWPNGGSQSAGNTTCNHLDAGTTTPASWYCDFSDSQGRDWEASKNL